MIKEKDLKIGRLIIWNKNNAGLKFIVKQIEPFTFTGGKITLRLIEKFGDDIYDLSTNNDYKYDCHFLIHNPRWYLIPIDITAIWREVLND